MIARFKLWLARRAAQRERTQWQRGREYAREQIEKSDDLVKTIEMLEAQASNPFDPDDFDRGITYELRAAQKPSP